MRGEPAYCVHGPEKAEWGPPRALRLYPAVFRQTLEKSGPISEISKIRYPSWTRTLAARRYEAPKRDVKEAKFAGRVNVARVRFPWEGWPTYRLG